jgi:hypothetical protein
MHVKRAIRYSPALRALQDASSNWVVRRPLDRVPGWLSRLHDIELPKGVATLAEPTPFCPANINVLISLLEQCTKLEGDIAECGVYRGGTLIPMSLHLKQRGAKKVAYGFDSFEGFDASVDSEIALGGLPNSEKRRGGFADTSYEYVDAKVHRFGLENHAKLVKGFLADTLPEHAERRFCFVHLDVDIYESYKIALQFFYPRCVPQGVILLDEYNDPPWPGCNKAVDEFLADKPEKLREIERDNYVKYFIRKE